MPDKKLTDNEIVKGLRSWLEEIRKARQAYLEKVNEVHYPSMRYEYLLSDTIHEITRLQAENENYSKNNQQMTSDILNLYKALEEAKAENERLKNNVTTLTKSISELTDEVERQRKDKDDTFQLAANIIDAEKTVIAQAKTEAVTEFAERLKKVYADFDENHEQIFYAQLITAIDCLLIGMVGGENGEEG